MLLTHHAPEMITVTVLETGSFNMADLVKKKVSFSLPYFIIYESPFFFFEYFFDLCQDSKASGGN